MCTTFDLNPTQKAKQNILPSMSMVAILRKQKSRTPVKFEFQINKEQSVSISMFHVTWQTFKLLPV